MNYQTVERFEIFDIEQVDRGPVAAAAVATLGRSLHSQL